MIDLDSSHRSVPAKAKAKQRLPLLRRLWGTKLHVAGVAHGTDSCKACDALFRLYAAAARAQNR